MGKALPLLKGGPSVAQTQWLFGLATRFCLRILHSGGLFFSPLGTCATRGMWCRPSGLVGKVLPLLKAAAFEAAAFENHKSWWFESTLGRSLMAMSEDMGTVAG